MARIDGISNLWRRLALALAPLLALILALAAGPALADSATLSAKDKAIYQRAFAALADDRWQEALDIAATAKDPKLAKVVHWLDLTRPGPGRSFAAMVEFLDKNPDWPLRETLLAQAERAMPETYPSDKILVWFADRDPLTAAGALKLANALMAEKKEQRARDIIRQAWIERDFTEDEETEFLARFGAILALPDHQARADRLLWRKKTDQVERLLPRLDEAGRALASARLALAAEAEGALTLVDAVPETLRRNPGLIVDLARYYRRNDASGKAIALFTEVPRQPGRADDIWNELERAARAALAAGDSETAYRLAAAHGGEGGDPFVEGEFLAGWIALRFLDRPQAARKHFETLYAGAKTVLTRARAAYWAGEALIALGDKAKAKAWYEKAAVNPTVFYGQLAAEILKAPKKIGFPGKTKPDPKWRGLELAKIIRQLGEIGEGERLRPFAMALVRQAKNAADFAAIAAIAREAKAEDVAVAIAKEARTRGIEIPEYLFPLIKLPPGKIVESALVLGVIRQESVFDADIVSPAGAMGLMQLMPATAKPLAKELGVKKFKTNMLVENATLNIRLGRLYLAKLIEDFGGSYVLTIAAYNAGPARVRQWIAANGDPRQKGADVVNWIEAIPFDETRNYVMRVLENLQVYRARLQSAAKIDLGADLHRGRAE